jgi:hypothetical protein
VTRASDVCWRRERRNQIDLTRGRVVARVHVRAIGALQYCAFGGVCGGAAARYCGRARQEASQLEMRRTMVSGSVDPMRLLFLDFRV